MALWVDPSPKPKWIHSLGSLPTSRVARRQRWELTISRMGERAVDRTVCCPFCSLYLPPKTSLSLRDLSPPLLVFSQSHRGFQVLCLVSEMVQVLPSGQDPLHILGHNILDSLHLTLQVPDSVISGTPTGLLQVNTGVN